MPRRSRPSSYHLAYALFECQAIAPRSFGSDQLCTFLMAAVAPADLSSQSQQLLDKLGQEQAGVRKHFYLLTFSRVLPETLTAAAGNLRDIGGISRADIATAVRLAFNDPLPPPGGGGDRGGRLAT